MNEERCKLCNKPYDHYYELFGRGCLENLYKLLKISIPKRIIKNKELYLCNRIAWRNSKFFLNKKQKYLLAEKYIALKYLDKIDMDSFGDLRFKISQDIKNISRFSKDVREFVDFKLNDVYELYNDFQNFKEIIEKLQNITLEELDEEIAKGVLKNISFVFDVTKKTNPIFYIGFYSMQYIFWQTVVVGGLFANMKLSAKLLNNSLIHFGKNAKDLVITDDETINQIRESQEFKQKIRTLVEKYGSGKNEFNINNIDNVDCNIEFNNKDLFLAIHGSSLNIEAIKNEDSSWNMDIEISDVYDFTDFKSLKKYISSNSSLPMSVFSTILNNFAVVSTEYGVIKPYKVTIKFRIENYK